MPAKLTGAPEEVYGVLDAVLSRWPRFEPIRRAGLKIEVLMAEAEEGKAALKKGGCAVLATVAKVPDDEKPRRDSFDLRIKLDARRWWRRAEATREAALCSALYAVKVDEEGKQVKRDQYGRPKFRLIAPDIRFQGFLEVGRWYGEASIEKRNFRALGELFGQGDLAFMGPDEVLDEPPSDKFTATQLTITPPAVDAGGYSSLDHELAAFCAEKEAERAEEAEASPAVRACRVCGCTDDDCRQCIEATGEPCHWISADLCSRCDEEIAVAEAARQEAEAAAHIASLCPDCGGKLATPNAARKPDTRVACHLGSDGRARRMGVTPEEVRRKRETPPEIQPMAAERLRRQAGTYTLEELGLTDLSAVEDAHSADVIGDKQKVRGIVTVDGFPYANVGGAGTAYDRTFDLEALIPRGEWTEKTLTLDECRKARRYGGDYHRGLVVKCRGKEYVLAGSEGLLKLHVTKPRPEESPKAEAIPNAQAELVNRRIAARKEEEARGAALYPAVSRGSAGPDEDEDEEVNLFAVAPSGTQPRYLIPADSLSEAIELAKGQHLSAGPWRGKVWLAGPVELDRKPPLPVLPARALEGNELDIYSGMSPERRADGSPMSPANFKSHPQDRPARKRKAAHA